jgi:adenosylcobinamide kinase / adenosylcobinamide-phosphate guanylyltransferase
MAKITLITGGARSGKSTRAIEIAATASAGLRYFIATGEALDDEMAARIARHQESRPPEFHTIEAPVNVISAIAGIERRAAIAIVDCLTLWVSNLMRTYTADTAILGEADRLATAFRSASFPIVVVTDEVGMGIVPDNAMSRRYRDLLGWTNQKIAAVADEVILMVSGYPLKVK